MGHYVKPLEDFAEAQHGLTYILKGQLQPLVENRLQGGSRVEAGTPAIIDYSSGVGGW